MYEQYKKQGFALIHRLQKGNYPIVIFGTEQLGFMTKCCLEFYNLSVSCFCDNNPDRIGTEMRGISVLHPEQAHAAYPDAVYFLTGIGKFTRQKMEEQLKEIDDKSELLIPDALFCIYVVEMTSRDIEKDVFAKNTFEWFNSQNTALYFNTITVHATEICTLNCKECVAGIPYIKDPKHCEKNTLIESVRNLASYVDLIGCVGFCGGECLLHPAILDIFEIISKISNILTFCVVTNGTHLPANKILQFMHEKNMILHISDYGEACSTKIPQIIKKCEQMEVLYSVRKGGKAWVSLGDFRKKNRPWDLTKKTFQNCVFAANQKNQSPCYVIYSGKLFLCGRYSPLLRLNPSYEVPENEYLDLLDTSSVNIQQKKEKLKGFLLNTEVLSACEYCNYPMPVIPAGEQL